MNFTAALLEAKENNVQSHERVKRERGEGEVREEDGLKQEEEGHKRWWQDGSRLTDRKSSKKTVILSKIFAKKELKKVSFLILR